MQQLQSQYLFTITITVNELHDLGTVPLGVRHLDMFGAGSFEGPRLRGAVLAGGIDQKANRNYKRPFGAGGKVSNRRAAKIGSLVTDIGWVGVAVGLPHTSDPPTTLEL